MNECVSGFFPLPLSRSLCLFVISRTMRAFPGHEERWMIRSEPADNTSLKLPKHRIWSTVQCYNKDVRKKEDVSRWRRQIRHTPFATIVSLEKKNQVK